MSKRVTLTLDDATLIVAALNHLHHDSVINPNAYSKYAIASRQRIQQIIDKLPKGGFSAALSPPDHPRGDGSDGS